MEVLTLPFGPREKLPFLQTDFLSETHVTGSSGEVSQSVLSWRIAPVIGEPTPDTARKGSR
jgi:hypothetical protein